MLSADGVRTEYTYDPRNRLTHLAKRTAAAALLFAATYTVDASGMRTAVEESDATGVERTLAFQYDDLKRLTQETIVVARDPLKNRITAWTYDKVGNRLTQRLQVGTETTPTTTAYTYDANDRLLTETTAGALTTYTYDANGNTKTKQSPGTLIEYAYDDANRLVEMKQAGTRFTYAYDADGLRIAQTEHGATPVTTHWLQDGSHAYSQVIEAHREQGGATQLEVVYNFADGLLSQTRYAGGVASTRFVHQDGFGSTRLLTDGGAVVSDRWSYDAFGNEIARDGVTPADHLYRGEQFDPNLGFYYLRARLYDPSSGHLLTLDPFAGYTADPPSLHRYNYNYSDPVNRIDPSGRESLISLNTAIAIVGVGSTLIHAGFRIAEGDYEGAAKVAARDAVLWAVGAGIGKAVVSLGKAAFGLFARKFVVPLDLSVTTVSSTILRFNLQSVMRGPGPIGWAAHHIVGAAYPAGKKAIQILDDVGINVNSPLNGVFLPGCGFRGSTSAAGLAVHCGVHTEAYANLVLRELEEVGGSAATHEAVVNVLSRLRRELLDGDLMLNSRGNL